ncbi:MAG: hypothetical protein LUG93_14750 [Lachnospiraceae bacterium]|nr:hypothetical protein [Lachnospiraceae bacterium]
MKVELQRGLSLDLPFYYDIIEGKVELTLLIREGPSGDPIRIDAGDILSWLKEDKYQKFPGSGRSFVLSHMSRQNIRCLSFLYQGHPGPGAYLEIQLSWKPVAVEKKLLGSGEKAERLSVSMGTSGDARETKEQIEALKKELKRKDSELGTCQKNLSDLTRKVAALTGQNEELRGLVERQADATFRMGGEYEKELERLEEALGADSEAIKALHEMQERKQAMEKQSEERKKEADALQKELEELKKKAEDQERELAEQRESIARIDALSEEKQEMLEQNRERLAQDEELLQFLKSNNIDIDKSLKEIEKLLRDTEEQMRKAIREKEEKAETIHRMSGGEQVT